MNTAAAMGRQVGVELAVAALPRNQPRGRDSSAVVVDLDNVGEADDARRERNSFALDPVGDALAVPPLV